MERVKSTDQEKILKRVKTIRGHFAAVERMIEEEQPFKEILLQLKAVRSAIHQVEVLAAQRYAQTIMDNGQEVNEAIKMLMDLNQSLVCAAAAQGHGAIGRQSNFKNYFFTEEKSFA